MTRFFILAAFFLVPLTASAANFDVKALVDTDNRRSTGCAVTTTGGIVSGIDVILTTTGTTTGATGTVTGVTRQTCVTPSLNLFSAPVAVDGGWNVGVSSTGDLFIESHYGPDLLTWTTVGSPRFVFTTSSGSLTDILITPNTTGGGDIVLRRASGRPRATASGPPRLITLDGSGADWDGVPPLANGTASSPAWRFISASAYAGLHDLFFNFQIHTNPAAPTANDDNYALATAGGTLTVATLGVLNNDNANGQAITAVLVSNPQHGTLTLNANGGFTYTHDGSLGPQDQFRYVAQGPVLPSNIATVTINLPGSHPYVFTSADSATFSTGQAKSFTVSVSGLPTPALTESGALPSGITFVDNGNGTGTLSGTAAGNAGGIYSIVFTAEKNKPHETSQNFTLTIGQPPHINSDAATTFTAGTSGTFTVTATGFPAPALSRSGALPAGVTFNTATGVLSGTPAPGSGGQYPITFNASNDFGSENQSFLLTVNEAPFFTSASATTMQTNVAASFNVTVGGYPAPTISRTGTLPSGITFTNNGNGTATIAGTAASGTGGTYPLVLSATNGIGAPASQNFTLTVNQPPAITSANAVTFTVGSAGTFTVTATGFPAPAIGESGTLPSGVTYNAATHVLSGTPAVGTGGVYPISFTASNGVGSNAVQTFTLTINEAASFTSVNAVTFQTGVAGTFSVTTLGFPKPAITKTGALPGGVTLTDNANGTATLAGTAAAGTGGTYPLTLTAANGVGANGTQNFTLTVNQPPAVTSANAVTFTVGSAGTFTVTASGFPAPAISESGTLPSGVTYNSATHVLSGTAAVGTGGVYPISFTASNGIGSNATQNFALTINEAASVTSANAVTFHTNVAGTFTITTLGYPKPAITESGALPTGVTLTDNANGTATLAGTPGGATGGTYPLILTVANGVGANGTQNFTLTVNQPPAITSANNATFQTGLAGTFTVTTTGFPNGASMVLSETGALPSGLSFADNHDGTATIAGTPAALTGGIYSLVLTANNGIAPNATQNFTLTVNQPPAITSANNVTFTVGAAGTFTLTTTGFPTGASMLLSKSGTLPTGVTFVDNHDGTATLSGTPAAATGGTYPLTITANNGALPNGTQNFTLTVNQAPAVTSANNVTFQTGVAGTFAVTTTGFPTGASMVITKTGALPAGVSFVDNNNGTATLAGTPGAGTGGTYPITITANNGVAPNGTQSFTLTVNQPPAITSANAVTFTVGTAGSFGVTVTGFPAPTVAETGALPSGVTFNAATKTLSGTPAVGTGGTYNITFTAANGVGANAPQSFTLTINEAPAVTANPANVTICAGAMASFTAAASGVPAATIQWQVDSGSGFSNISGATSGTYSFATVAGDDNKLYRAVFTNSSGVATTTSASLRVDTMPVVTTNPVTQTICAGTTVTFVAAANSNAGQTVQWQVDSGSGFTNIVGQTSLSYSFVAATSDTGKQYRAVFTNSCGSTNTTAATLSVDSLPVVTTNPASTAVCPGNTATFTAAATSNAGDHTVKWQVNSGSGFTDVPGATSLTYSFTVVVADNNKQYRAVFTDACGATNTTAATLTVNSAPVVTTNPTNQTVCAGTTATFTAAASGQPTATVQWQVDSGSGFNDIAGATSTTYSFSTVAGDNGKLYRARFTNVCGANVATTAATLRVDTLPIVTVNPATQTVCAGASVSFIATASSNAGHTIQWQVNSGSGFTNIAGATTGTLTFTSAAADNGKQYRAVFTDACGSTNSTAATLTADTIPVVTTAPVNQAVCAGATATFTAAATSNAGDHTVQWQADSGSGFTNIGGATGTTYSFSAVSGDNGKIYRAVFTDACGSTSTSSATLRVDTLPVVSTDPITQTLCAGATVTFTAAATSNAGHTVQWQLNSGAGFANIAGATSLSYSFVIANADNGRQYRAVFTNSCGNTNTAAATLTVDTLPVVTTDPVNQTVCTGATATFTAAATSNAADQTVQWQVDSGSGFTNVAGATSTTYSFLTVAGDNGKSYRAVFTTSCGSTNSAAATLRADTPPVVTTNPLTQTLCAGATATFTVAATSNAGHTVQWQVNSGAGFTNIAGATSTTYSFPSGIGDNGKIYRAVFTNSCGNSNSTSATLTVDTLPVVTTSPLTQAVCAGATVNLTAAATSNASDHTVQWQVDTGSGFNDIAGATSTTYSFVAATGDNGKIYRAVFTSACGSVNTASATLRVDTLPVVTTDPLTQTLCAGATVTFTVAATSNAGHTVQWQIDTGSAFTDIAGATSLSYSFVTANGDNGRQYRAVFTNSCGNTNTAAATLTVDTLPSVTTSPVTQTVCAGATVNLTAAATSNAGDHTVQWQVKVPAGSFTDIPGATSNTLSFTATTGQTGNQYQAVFTTACGTATTSIATLTVDTLPVVTTNPVTQTVCAGATVTLTAAATSNASDHTVQWQVKVPAGSFTDIPGATSNTLSFTSTTGQTGNQYQAVFTTACGTTTTSVATLTVDTLPVVTTNPVTQSVCAGATVNLIAAATSNASDHTVQWQVKVPAGSFTDIPGATSTTLSFTATTGQIGNQYQAVFTTACGIATTSIATLTVDTLPVVTTNPVTQTVCAGATVNLTAAATSNASDHTVKWQVKVPAGSFTDIPGATSTTLSFTSTTGQTGNQYQAVFTDACGTTTTSIATLTVDTLPSVTTNPVTQTVCAGGTATFTAAATSNASDHTVQWQVKVPAGSFTDIPGATSTTLSFTSTTGQNGNQYQAVFTTACGTTTTSIATLTVDTIPVVTTNPLTQTVCAGGTATFTASATSNASNHTVQWQVKVPAGSFTDIVGATSTTLSFTATAGQNGNQYQAVFTDACGTTTTSIATLTVDTLPVVTTNPVTQTVCAGGTATFTAAATSNASDQTVQWQVKVPAGSFTNIVGATSTTLSFTSTAGQNGNQYQAVFTTACGTTTTSIATLTVDTLPVITTNPLTQTVCAGATVNLTAAATSNASDHTVQWQVKVPAGSFTDIPGATSTTLSFTATSGMNGNQYQAVFTDFCGNATTSVATLTVDTIPVVTTNPLTQSVCAGATATFTAAATSNAADQTVQWQVNSVTGYTNIVGATSTTYSFVAATGDNNMSYRAVFTDACGSTNTTVATLTVNTAPAVTLDPVSSTVCAGATATFTASASGSPSPAVQWQVDDGLGGGFVNIGGATSTTLSFTSTAAMTGYKYRAVFTNVCTTATTNFATLTVNTTPAVTTHPLTQSVQSGSNVTFVAAASGSPSPTVQWEVSTDGGTSFTPIGGATSTSYSFTAALSQNGNLYHAIFTNACGTVTTNNATLTVTCAPATVTRNGGGTFPAGTYNVAYTGQSVTASGGAGPYTFAVTSGSLPTSLSMSGAGAISGTPSQTGTFTFTVTATETPTGCTGSQSFSIAINPAASNDSYSNLVFNTQAVVTGGTSAAAANRAAVPLTGTISSNDAPSGGIALTTGTFATTNGGSITIAADGTFTYTPPVTNSATATPTPDTFTYTITSNTGATATPTTAQGTITLNFANRVWYVDNTNGGTADGRSNTPFTTLGAAEAAGAAATGEIIYVYTGGGTYNTATATTGLSLTANQQLIGQGVALVVNTVTLKAAGTKPTITNSTATSDAITLAAGNMIKGIKVSLATRYGISGNAVAGFTGDTLEIGDGTTPANGNTGSGLHLVGMTAAVAVTNSTITDKSGTATSLALDVSGGSAAMSFNNTNTIKSASGTALSIVARTGGTIDLSATINASGKGIVITNSGASGAPVINFTGSQTLNTTTNPAVTMSGAGAATLITTFSGTLNVTTSTGSALSATGGGTLNVTGTANITTGAATNGINLNGVTVGASGVTFTTVNTTGATTGVSLTSLGNGNVAINSGTISGGTTGLSLSTLGTSTVTLGANAQTLTVTGATTTAISGSTFGTLAIATGSTVNISGASALALTTGTVSGTFNNVTATAGNVSLTGVLGTWGTNLGSITGAAGGPAFNVNGGSGSITWGDGVAGANGSITQSLANTAVVISGANSATITFKGNITPSGASTGINISGSSGTYAFNGTNAITAGGITIGASETGSITFASGTSLTGVALTVTGPTTPNITYSGTMSTTAGNYLIDVNGLNNSAGNGKLIVNGSLLSTTGSTGTGIRIQNSSSLTINIVPTTLTMTMGGSDAITLSGNSGNISITGVNYTTTGNFSGVVLAGGGNITIGGTLNGTGSNVAVLRNSAASNATLMFSSATVTGAAAAAAVNLTNTFTGTLQLTSSTVNTVAGGGIIMAGGTFGSLGTSGNTITGSGTALSLTGMALGSVASFGNISSTNATGISFTSVTGGSFVVGGGTLSGNSTAAFNSTTSTASFTYNGAITNPTGRIVNISNASANGCGTLTFGGAINTNVGTGININQCNAGTITFSNGTKTINTGTNAAVTITNNAGATIAFTNGGLALTTSSGAAFAASGTSGTLEVSGANNTISSGSGNGFVMSAINIGANGVTFATVSTSGAATGISLTNGGSNALTVNGGSIVNASSAGLLVSGGTGNVTCAASITTSGALAATHSVSIASHTGGTVGISGAITDNAGGVTLTNNTGATINISGGLTLSTVANPAFVATGGGTVNLTGTNNATTNGGTTINVTDTIGGSGMTWRSVAAGTGAAGSGPSKAIILNGTGSGNFTVTGDGSTANSGGVIRNTTGTPGSNGQGGTGAVDITGGTGTYTFRFMKILAPGGNGFMIFNSASTVSIEKTTIDHNNNAIANSFAVRDENHSGTSTLTLDGVLIQNKGDGSTATSVSAQDTGNITYNIQDSNTGDAFDMKFTNLFGSGVVAGAGDNAGATGTVTVNVSNAKFIAPMANGINDLEMNTQASSVLNFNISNNTFNLPNMANAFVGAINVNATQNGRIGSSGNPGTIDTNTISNINGSAGGTGYYGIRIAPDNAVSTPQNHRILIQNNNLSSIRLAGILLSARGGSTMNVKVLSNTIGTLASPVGITNRRGIEMETQANANMFVQLANNPSIVNSGTSNSNSAVAFRAGTDNVEGAANGTINATVTGNTIKNSASAGTGGWFRAETGLNTASICLDYQSNVLRNSADANDPTKEYNLVHNTTGTFTRRSVSNVGTETIGAGSIGSNSGCTAPTF